MHVRDSIQYFNTTKARKVRLDLSTDLYSEYSWYLLGEHDGDADAAASIG